MAYSFHIANQQLVRTQVERQFAPRVQQAMTTPLALNTLSLWPFGRGA